MRTLAAPALFLLGCTSLLGVDGEYRIDPGEGGAGSTTTTAALASVATGQGGGGADAATTGGGGTGGTGGSGAGGFPGEAPFPPGTCERCAVTFAEEPIAGASQPRLAHLSDSRRLAYVRSGTVTLLEEGEEEASFPVTGPASPLALVNDDFTAPYFVWTSGDALFGGGDPFFDPVARPFIHGARIESQVFVAATIEDDRPALLDCERNAELAEPCQIVPNSLCDTPMPGALGRNVAVDRRGETVHFARICGDAVEVLQPTTGPVWTQPADGAEEVAVTLTPDGLYVLVIVHPGEADAAVRLYAPQQELITHPVPGASAPAMIPMDAGVVGTFATPWGLVIASCEQAGDCTFGMLVADAMNGASEPSLGTFVGGAREDDRWIAWEQGGAVHHGRLGAP